MLPTIRLWWWGVAASCADGLTTLVMLQHPQVNERNPFMAALMNNVGVIPTLSLRVIIGVIAFSAVAFAAIRATHNTRFYNGVLFVLAGFTTLVAVWNVSLIVRTV